MNRKQRLANIRQRRIQKCRHFTGSQNRICMAEVEYPKPLPCFGELIEGNPGCEKYSAYTAEELKEQDKKLERMQILGEQGLSFCCEAKIDESRVLPNGHGPRFCSKCKNMLFIV